MKKLGKAGQYGYKEQYGDGCKGKIEEMQKEKNEKRCCVTT
jgi:ribosomal protein L37AE/L43A